MKIALPVASFVALVLVGACSKEQTQSSQTPTNGQATNGQYSQGAYGSQQNSGQYQGAGQSAGTTNQPTYTQPAATATSTATNPFALACQTDATCITAKCNLQTGHCNFPCAASTDCQTGNGCVAGACIPGAP